MFTHIVLLKLKEGTLPAEAAVALEHVQALQQSIPGIVSVQVGENLNNSNNQGYTHGFVMQFTSAEMHKQYAQHPAHEPVSLELRSISESIIDFDIEK